LDADSSRQLIIPVKLLKVELNRHGNGAQLDILSVGSPIPNDPYNEDRGHSDQLMNISYLGGRVATRTRFKRHSAPLA
jgi:hypothetical protein